MLVATDYEGLGTPGNYPVPVRRGGGRGVLDSVRAAANSFRTPATPATS